jgi:hypothetical protein
MGSAASPGRQTSAQFVSPASPLLRSSSKRFPYIYRIQIHIWMLKVLSISHLHIPYTLRPCNHLRSNSLYPALINHQSPVATYETSEEPYDYSYSTSFSNGAPPWKTHGPPMKSATTFQIDRLAREC